MSTTNQKRWVELLEDALDTPLYCAKNYINSGKYVPGKQFFRASKPLPYDHRAIGSNEVVIELDAQSFAQNSRYAKQITSTLISQEVPFYCFWSGNKSIHIHVFLELNLTNKEGMELIEEAIQKGCNIYREIRLKFARDAVVQAGLNPEIIGSGKIVDLQKLYWDDLNGKNTLIRICGGANKKIDKVDSTKVTGAHKTYLDIPLPDKKPADNQFEDCIYPPTIEKYEFPESEIIEIAQRFLERYKEVKNKDKDFTFEGKYLGSPCVQKIIEGLPAGKRSYGASTLAIACRLDGMSKAEAMAPFKQYVKNCPQIPDIFDFSEAERWLDWVYKQPRIFWNCAHAMRLGICDKTDCAYHLNKYKDELAVLDVTEPLTVIKDALDIMAVGEDAAKMQLFLLYLTKEFNPEWCIIIDGPASSGKTHIMKAVANLFGEENEEFFVYSRFTKASLNHIDELSQDWKGKIVIIEELQGSKDVVEQLRVAISEGKLTLLRSKEVKGEDGTKEFITEPKLVNFDNLFCTCNAEEYDEGDQLLSRAWIINTDISEDQTKEVMDTYLDEFSGKLSLLPPNLDSIRTAIKFLAKPDKILFPFAEELKGWLPATSVRARRDIKKMIALVKASAYFHQRQREWVEHKGKKLLVADWRDVIVSFRIAGEALNASTQGLGAVDLKDWENIIDKLTLVGKKDFNTGDVCRWLHCNRSTARNKAATFSNAGLVENRNAPPLPAFYQLTSVGVQTMDLEYFVGQAEEFMEKQDGKIKTWIKDLRKTSDADLVESKKD